LLEPCCRFERVCVPRLAVTALTENAFAAGSADAAAVEAYASG
jgi:hypothetical protein